MLLYSLPFPDSPLNDQVRRVQAEGLWLHLRCEGEYAVVRYGLPACFADLYYAHDPFTPAFVCTQLHLADPPPR